MHEPVKENLEDYLKGYGDREMPPELAAHLGACSACAEELREIAEQARLFQALRCDVEPRPGFYARIVDRIDRQTDNSIWAIFLRPAVGRRLAIASATLALMLGAYLISTERTEQTPQQPVAISSPWEAGPDFNISASASLAEQRNAVLVNLASYHE
jgi:predicted anti-sigma-YlaC factor YlaD